MNKRETLVAWVEIWHPMSNMKICTIKEPCESRDEALEQFGELHKVISQWTSDYDGIVLDTEEGMLRIPSGFIASSILQIKVETQQSEDME